MRRSGSLLAAFAVVAVATGCGGSASRFSPILPQKVQREIVRKWRESAYVPTELPAFPTGSHFTNLFSPAPGEFGIEFSGPGGPAEVSFEAARVGQCRGASMHMFHRGGVRIRWSSNGVDQEAWRCVKRGQLTIWISAGRSVFGDDSLRTPQERIDAMLLVRMVEHIKFIG